MGRPAVIALFVLSLLPSAYLAWQGRDLPHLGSFHDDAIYLETARNLACENTYKIGSLPWAPAQTKYPPLYPLYLSIAWRITPDLDKALPIAMFLNWLWLPIWVIGIHRLLKPSRLHPWLKLALPLLIAVHPDVQLASIRIMSDLMCAALITWSLATRNPFLAALTYLVRSAALPLIAALAITDLYAKRWRSAATGLAIAAVPIVGWAIWVAANRHHGTTSIERYYTDYIAYQLEMIPISGIPGHMYQQLDPLINSISRLLLLNSGWVILERLAAFAAISGVIRLMRSGQMQAYGVYGLLMTTMMLIWYFPLDNRALLPALPLIWLGFTEELRCFMEILKAAWSKRPAERAFAAIFATICATLPLAMLYNATANLSKVGEPLLRSERQLFKNTRAAFRWIEANTTKQTHFYTVDDPVFALYTNRKALRSPELDRAFTRTKTGQYTLSPQGIADMNHFNLPCLFLSAKHFESDQTISFSLENTGLSEIYRSGSELVACRLNSLPHPISRSVIR